MRLLESVTGYCEVILTFLHKNRISYSNVLRIIRVSFSAVDNGLAVTSRKVEHT